MANSTIRGFAKEMDVYLAGPWFNEEQMQRLEKVKEIIVDTGYNIFSPKDENLWKPGEDKHKIVIGNVTAILECDVVVVITDGKDVGTIFEAGYAYARNKEILYVWLSHAPEQKFNIMLAETGALALTLDELRLQLEHYAEYECFLDNVDKGLQYE